MFPHSIFKQQQLQKHWHQYQQQQQTIPTQQQQLYQHNSNIMTVDHLTKGVPDLFQFFKSTTTTAVTNHQKELRKSTWRRVSLIFFNFSRRSSSVSGSPSSWHKYQITIWIYISKLKYPNIFLQPQISMANIILLKNYPPGAGPFDRPRQTSRSDSPCWSNIQNDRGKYVFNKDWGAMSCFSSILAYLIWYSPPGRSSFLYPFLSLPKLDCF